MNGNEMKNEGRQRRRFAVKKEAALVRSVKATRV